MLNSPLVRDSARALADSVRMVAGENPARIRLAYEQLFSRPPTELETNRALRFLEQAESRLAPDQRSTAWPALCQSLLAANEFLYRE